MDRRHTDHTGYSQPRTTFNEPHSYLDRDRYLSATGRYISTCGHFTPSYSSSQRPCNQSSSFSSYSGNNQVDHRREPQHVSWPASMEAMVKVARIFQNYCGRNCIISQVYSKTCKDFVEEADAIKQSLDSKLRALNKFAISLENHQFQTATYSSRNALDAKLQQEVADLKKKLGEQEDITASSLSKVSLDTDKSIPSPSTDHLHGSKELDDKYQQTIKYKDKQIQEILAKVKDNTSRQAHLPQSHILEDMKHKYEEEIKSKDREICVLQADLKDITHRLSQLMHGKMNLNETSIENVSVINRPSQVAEAFTAMMNNEWLDASLSLDTYDTNDISHFKTLTVILKTAWSEAKAAYNDFKQEIFLLITNPFPASGSQQMAQHKVGLCGNLDMPTELQSAMLNILKQNSDKINIKPLVQRTTSKIRHSQRSSDRFLYHRAVVNYIEKCCLVVWKMAIQQPQMNLTVDRHGMALDKTSEELYFESKSTGLIAAYVKPGLMHSDKCLVKALVILQ